MKSLLTSTLLLAHVLFGLVAGHCEESPRAIVFPAKALIGHWKNKGTNEEFWFDGKTATKLDVSGGKLSWPYVVTKNARGESIVTIKAKMNQSGDFDTEFRIEFAPDKRSIHCSSRHIALPENAWADFGNWLYADDQHSPAVVAAKPSGLSKALIGHWKSKGVSTGEFWFDGKAAVMQDVSGGRSHSPYTVKANAPGGAVAMIHFSGSVRDWGSGIWLKEFRLEFSPDKRSVHAGWDDWVYLDDQQSPGGPIGESHDQRIAESQSGQTVAPTESEESKREREAAQAAASKYVQELKVQGVVSDDDFQVVILYPNLPVAEVIYTLTYVNKAGVKVTGPYTIHVINRGAEWHADGSMAGDRRKHLNDPFIGIDGRLQRSPMEQATEDAINRGMSQPAAPPR